MNFYFHFICITSENIFMTVKKTELKKLLKKTYGGKKLSSNYVTDKQLSGKRVKVIRDTNTNKTYVAHRGTASLKDWATDFAMALGYEGGKRFKHAESIQHKAEKKYGRKNIVTIGHSLGGRIAEKVGKKSSEIVTYNKAVTPRSIVESYIKPYSKKQTDIRTKTDPVSAGALLQDRNKKLVTVGKATPNLLKAHNLNQI